jgi:methylated-DNA-[protein]-cysteine S-methyltransferase
MLTKGMQSIGGFFGEAQNAPSGVNNKMKRELLEKEGVVFDERGKLVDEGRWWDDFKL